MNLQNERPADNKRNRQHSVLTCIEFENKEFYIEFIISWPYTDIEVRKPLRMPYTDVKVQKPLRNVIIHIIPFTLRSNVALRLP